MEFKFTCGIYFFTQAKNYISFLSVFQIEKIYFQFNTMLGLTYPASPKKKTVSNPRKINTYA